MRSWTSLLFLAAVGSVGFGSGPSSASAQDYEPYAVEARVWLDRGTEPVLERGERARIYYRVSESAFVSIFHIDTNGNVRMVFPTSPHENHYARAGRDYRVLFPGSSYWYVRDDPGMGYFFIVASPEPLDFGAFQYSRYAGGWDLSGIGQHVYRDPYLAMDDYVAALVPGWEYVAYGLDFTAYHVERRHDYPRFLCYDCHGFQPYYSWNPYRYSCASFRVVIYDDPYYYPVTRYRGTRVVYVQPRRGVAHFGFKERARGEAGTPQVVTRRTPPPSNRPGVESNGNRRAVPRSGVPSAFSPGETAGRQPGVGSVPGVDGTRNRRSGTTSSSVSGSRVTSGTVTPRSSRPGTSTGGTAQARPGATRPTGTTSKPTLERRPGSGSSATSSGRTVPSRTTRPSTRVTKPGGGTTSGSSGTVSRGGTRSSVAGSGSRNAGSSRSSSSAQTSRGSTRTTPTARSTGGSSRTSPTVRSTSGSSRTTPTVRSTGGSSRTSPTVRSTSGSSRTTPTVRRTGGSSRTSPTVRSTGGSSRTKPTVRSTGGSRTSPTRTPARTTRPKVRKPGGGGGSSP